MPEKHFAPLDQYQPLVDEDGRITAEWYSWLLLICEELNALDEAVNTLLDAAGRARLPRLR